MEPRHEHLGQQLSLLQCWELAYRTVGEAALPPFGLSEADIDAILTVDEAAWRRWAMSPLSLVQPRRGLLTALRAGNDPRVHSFVVRPRAADDTGDRPAAGAANAHLLATWRRAASNPDLSRLFDLDQEDVAALTAAEEAALEEWSTLPIALATPRPGLLPAMFEIAQPQLVAFLQSMQH